MSILSKHFGFVNEQVGLQTKFATKFEKQEWRSSIHLNAANLFKELAADLMEADRLLDEGGGTRPFKPSKLALTAQDVEGLPEELLAELTFSGGDKAEMAIVQIINDNGGIASLDQIIVAIYRKTGEISKRSQMTSKLYRMSQKGLLFSVPNKKGAYSSALISEDDAKSLFGADEPEIRT